MTQSTIRIALVITELEVGGAERCLANLACGLDRTRFEPVIYCLAPQPLPPRDALVAQLVEAGVPVHFLGFSSKWQLPMAVRSAGRALARQAPHVIQSMLFHANVVAGLVKRRLPDTGLSLGIRVADPSRWRPWVERRAARQADRVVCVSQLVADYAARHVNVPRDKLSVIPNGIDVTAVAGLRPADLAACGVPSGRSVIVCVSRLERQKGVDRLLAAAPRLLERLVDHDLLIVGDGRQAASLRRLATRLGIESRVHFAGWRPNVAEILLASDLLILPSRWEGMPNVLLEAMACGRPVACTSAEGVQEVLGPLADRQTAPASSPQTLIEKALSIVGDPLMADRLGHENRQRIAAEFSLNSMVANYERLFETLSRRSRSL